MESELFPTVPELHFAGAAEDTVREVGRAEADVADQSKLFVLGGRSLGGLDFRRQPDRHDIVAGAILPATGRSTAVCEIEIVAASLRDI